MSHLGMDVGVFRGLLSAAPVGPRMEIGVLRGSTLAMIAAHSGETYGVDSFEGMAEPGERDIVNGINNYPKGRFATPVSIVQQAVPSAILIKGFVPEILSNVPDGPFAFVHLDLDHYGPTNAALEWLFPRMMAGGILLCDDWFDGQDFLAAGALNEVAIERPLSGTNGRKAWWVF